MKAALAVRGDVMGWNSGAKLVWECWRAIKPFIPPADLRDAAEAVYHATSGNDFRLSDDANNGDILGRVAAHIKYVSDGAPATAEEWDEFVLDPTGWGIRLIYRDGCWTPFDA